MGTIETRDGTEIFNKDWGKNQPIVFSHGWPLSADDRDRQMLFFLEHARGTPRGCALAVIPSARAAIGVVCGHAASLSSPPATPWHPSPW